MLNLQLNYLDKTSSLTLQFPSHFQPLIWLILHLLFIVLEGFYKSKPLSFHLSSVSVLLVCHFSKTFLSTSQAQLVLLVTFVAFLHTCLACLTCHSFTLLTFLRACCNQSVFQVKLNEGCCLCKFSTSVLRFYAWRQPFGPKLAVNFKTYR